MASKSGAGASPGKQRVRPSPIQIAKTSQLAPVTPKPVLKGALQVASEQDCVGIVGDIKASKTYKLESVDLLTKKVDSGFFFLSNPKEVCQDSGLPEGSSEEEKKASEHGISSASAKSSDGATSLANTLLEVPKLAIVLIIPRVVRARNTTIPGPSLPSNIVYPFRDR